MTWKQAGPAAGLVLWRGALLQMALQQAWLMAVLLVR
jgi:hypothetical protein